MADDKIEDWYNNYHQAPEKLEEAVKPEAPKFDKETYKMSALGTMILLKNSLMEEQPFEKINENLKLLNKFIEGMNGS